MGAKNGRHEPVEELETVSLQRDDPGKIIQIGSRLKDEQKQELVHCLQAHADVFAWTHKDMLGIDPEVACHRLAIKKGCSSSKAENEVLQPGEV